MRYVFEQIRVGGDRNFGYLLGDRQAGVSVVVDPSYSPEKVVRRAREQSLEVRTILNTHGHSDHTNGNAKAQALTGAPLAAYEGSVPEPELRLGDGSRLEAGGLTLQMLYTPGHAPDHLVIHVPDLSIALTGDLLFVGKVGGTSTVEDARDEWESLNRLLRELPAETTIWPGHDYGSRPSSTLALEKQSNPFLDCEDFQAFLELKKQWAQFKSKHGLI